MYTQMKKLFSYITLVAAGAFLLTACKKQYDTNATFTTTDGTTYIRFIHAAPSLRQIFSQRDSLNIFVNNAKVNGAFLTFSNVFPASSNYGYISVPSGLQQIKLSVAGTVNPDSIQLINFTKIFQANQKYTVMITDSVNAANDSAKMIIPDTYSKPLPGNYVMRFVHAVWNDTTGKTIDIYSTRMNRLIGTNLKPGAITNFITLPYNSQLNDTLYIRRFGTTFNLATLNGVSFSNQRAYTLYYRGDGNLTTGTKARAMERYVHE
jgi:hypothetical protein